MLLSKIKMQIYALLCKIKFNNAYTRHRITKQIFLFQKCSLFLYHSKKSRGGFEWKNKKGCNSWVRYYITRKDDFRLMTSVYHRIQKKSDGMDFRMSDELLTCIINYRRRILGWINQTSNKLLTCFIPIYALEDRST
jgi:hypothetical protein